MTWVVVAPSVNVPPEVAFDPNQNIGSGLYIGYVAVIVIGRPTPLSVESGNCVVVEKQLFNGLQVVVALWVVSVTFSRAGSRDGAWCEIMLATSSTLMVQLLALAPPVFLEQVRPCWHA